MRRIPFVLLATLTLPACASRVTGSDTENIDATDTVTPADSGAAVTLGPTETRSCTAVQAACTTSPQTFVRGHATGLTGIDGARVLFAVRYLLEAGNGLDVPHGVVSGMGTVTSGSFDACVCVPMAANAYPQIAAVAFTAGSTGTTSRDVSRATFSQRYATLGDEDFSMSLAATTTAGETEAALAAMSDRVADLTVNALDATVEGRMVRAGLVADERPIAAQLVAGAVQGGSVSLRWIMPGVQYPSERLAIMVDTDGDNLCTAADRGALVSLGGRTTLEGITWVTGASIQPVCESLALDMPRGG